VQLAGPVRGGGEELQRCKKERKVLIRAVRELRRCVRKLREADRKADAVSAYWGSGKEPIVPSTQRAADDWIEVYLRELHVSDSEDEAPPSPPPSLPRDGDAFDATAAAARDTAAAAARFVRACLPAPSPPGRGSRGLKSSNSDVVVYLVLVVLSEVGRGGLARRAGLRGA